MDKSRNGGESNRMAARKEEVVKDSILVQHNIVLQGDLIFFLEQDSIRFEKLKRLEIFHNRGEYLGTFRVVKKSVFKVKNLNDMVSLMMFGELAEYGKEKLKRFRIKGRMSDETNMCLLCMEFLKMNNDYK